MKKWLTLGLVIALSGCASSTLDTLDPDDYYALVRQTPGLAHLEDDNIQAIGQNICDAFDSGNDYRAVLQAATQDGVLSAGDAGVFIALSVRQYCSNHLDDIHA